MRDTNYSFASLFDKSISLEYELPLGEIKKLTEDHKIKHPREVESSKPSKAKFSGYLKELGVPSWEVEIFEKVKDVEQGRYRDFDNTARFIITQSVIPLSKFYLVIITNAIFLSL